LFFPASGIFRRCRISEIQIGKPVGGSCIVSRQQRDSLVALGKNLLDCFSLPGICLGADGARRNRNGRGIAESGSSC
jgi:hypothetical protein